MIVDIFAGFLIICLLLLFAYACSLAITFWFISIPLAFLGLYWYNKRYHRIQRNLPPEVKAKRAADLARIQAGWKYEKEAKARRKAMRGY